MSSRLELDAEAQDEIDAAVAWYDAQTGDGLVGDQLLRAIDRALVHIVEQPGAFKLVPGVARAPFRERAHGDRPGAASDE